MPVMLLIMMITFFKPPPITSVTSVTGANCQGPYLEQPERVERVHQFYLDKLHAYLHLRYVITCSALTNYTPTFTSGTVQVDHGRLSIVSHMWWKLSNYTVAS